MNETPATSEPSLLGLALKEGDLGGEEPHVLRRDEQDKNPTTEARLSVSPQLPGEGRNPLRSLPRWPRSCMSWPGCLTSWSFRVFNSELFVAGYRTFFALA